MNRIERLHALAAESEPDAREILTDAADTMADMQAELEATLSVRYRAAIAKAKRREP